MLELPQQLGGLGGRLQVQPHRVLEVKSWSWLDQGIYNIHTQGGERGEGWGDGHLAGVGLLELGDDGLHALPELCAHQRGQRLEGDHGLAVPHPRLVPQSLEDRQLRYEVLQRGGNRIGGGGYQGGLTGFLC